MTRAEGSEDEERKFGKDFIERRRRREKQVGGGMDENREARLTGAECGQRPLNLQPFFPLVASEVARESYI